MGLKFKITIIRADGSGYSEFQYAASAKALLAALATQGILDGVQGVHIDCVNG
jgi:hypothetical protein